MALRGTEDVVDETDDSEETDEIERRRRPIAGAEVEEA